MTDYFDLIAGTSTGGIIALGLGLGLSASEILSFYEEFGPQVFRRSRIKGILSLGFSRYSNQALKTALGSVFGDRRLGESSNRLLIPALNLENGEVHVYKTAHHPKLERDYREKAVYVALATAAAPTYFPTYRSEAGIPLVDGGIWANNPTGMAVVEAIGILGWHRDSLRVLSLGCTSEALRIGKARFVGLGTAYWATRLVGLFLTAQSSSSLGTAHVLAGHEAVLRINPTVPPGRFRLDASKETISLKGLGVSEARKWLPKIRGMFIDEGHVEPFEPHRNV